MAPLSETMKNDLLAVLAPHGQEHLLAFWDRLDEVKRQTLTEQIRAIDFEQIERLYRNRRVQRKLHSSAVRAEPPAAFRLDASKNRFSPDQAKRRGMEALAAGRLGVVLVAGGQGTRLGFEHPKGMFPIAPVSRRSLFQIHVEKLIAVGRRHGVRIPLYLMTSPATHNETAKFFAENNRFGLAEEDLHIFCQGTMPAVDAATGKVLLEEPGRIALSPDGHGGMLSAMDRSAALDDIHNRGVEQLFYFQVDNPLVEVCSPEFVGYHLLAGSELSSQVVAKRAPLEPLGNVVAVDGRLVVIEYSDLAGDEKLVKIFSERSADGSLVLWAGSIAVHMMDAAFLRRMADSADALPFHLAEKKAPHIDQAGRLIEPTEPNAVKFERFIFDLIPAAENAIVVEIDPADGFAPLKNATGAKTDTPEHVKAQMSAQHRRWLTRAGAKVADDVTVEICPMFALDAEELAGKIEPGTRVTEPTYFC